MTNPLLWFLRPRRRPSGTVEGLIGFAMLAALILFVYPFFDCPCGAQGPIRFVGTPTEDRAEFVLTSCDACRRSGRLSMFDRCFGDAPATRP